MNQPDPKSSVNAPEDYDWGDISSNQDEDLGNSANKLDRPEQQSANLVEDSSEWAESPAAQAFISADVDQPDENENEALKPSRSGKLIDPILDQAKDAGESREIEVEEWGESKKLEFQWILKVALFVITVIVFALIVLIKSNSEESLANQKPDSDNQKIIESEDQGEIEKLILSYDVAKKIYHQYATASMPDDLFPILRKSANMKSLVDRTPHRALAPSSWQPKTQLAWSVHKAYGIVYGLLVGEHPDFSKFRAYFVKNGENLYLDWSATTAYGTATFDELSHGQGDPSEIRGLLFPSNYYSLAYPEERYICYKLISPDEKIIIWCYSDRSSLITESIFRLFRPSEIVQEALVPKLVTVRLAKGPKDARSNQWLIADLLHEEWISPSPPLNRE